MGFARIQPGFRIVEELRIVEERGDLTMVFLTLEALGQPTSKKEPIPLYKHDDPKKTPFPLHESIRGVAYPPNPEKGEPL